MRGARIELGGDARSGAKIARDNRQRRHARKRPHRRPGSLVQARSRAARNRTASDNDALTLHNSFECSDRFFINVAPMMNATHHSSCRSKAALASRCCAALVFGAALVAAQSRIIRPTQSNSNNSGKRQHVATLRSSDTAEGSRVAINSDQSLSDYEAYRRGDRFYVKIPAADVPRAEATRGRGFADVKVQRVADSTVISFRLQPGTTAHVEQRSNKLDVVFNAPGSARGTATGSNVSSPQAGS